MLASSYFSILYRIRKCKLHNPSRLLNSMCAFKVAYGTHLSKQVSLAYVLGISTCMYRVLFFEITWAINMATYELYTR